MILSHPINHRLQPLLRHPTLQQLLRILYPPQHLILMPHHHLIKVLLHLQRRLLMLLKLTVHFFQLALNHGEQFVGLFLHLSLEVVVGYEVWTGLF